MKQTRAQTQPDTMPEKKQKSVKMMRITRSKTESQQSANKVDNKIIVFNIFLI